MRKHFRNLSIVEYYRSCGLGRVTFPGRVKGVKKLQDQRQIIIMEEISNLELTQILNFPSALGLEYSNYITGRSQTVNGNGGRWLCGEGAISR